MKRCSLNPKAEVPIVCSDCVLYHKKQCLADQYPVSEYGFYFEGKVDQYRYVSLVVNQSDGMAVLPKSAARKDKLRRQLRLFQAKEVSSPENLAVSDVQTKVTYQIRK